VADEWVWMTHEGIEGVAGPVTRKAFEDHHSHKDWVEVPNPGEEVPPRPESSAEPVKSTARSAPAKTTAERSK
jgi:hypothetical protein